MTSGEVAAAVSPWLTVKEAAQRAKCSDKLIYYAIRSGRLRASRLGSRKDLRILEEWLDAWIASLSTPTIINPDAPGDDPPPGPIPFTRRGPTPRR